ncbi:hypothetical protein [Algoriphagus aquimarinus]|uniref:DUF3945 domain-containing protein n=1 Tax=Algoriphagus aquimarinus TaxID=237018 RepID=A0A5C7AXD1_9BACT|nr:hypothetical protein [Algoriphagus aquimarinus]TXE13416.1 hypothetical protein ESV85_05430 [Algoriphagus aquimarinus]
MNEQNFDYLKNQVKYSGFGDSLEAPLKEQIQKGEPDFSLKHQADFGGDTVNANLHFRKSALTDMYFFNKYDLSLTKSGQDEPAINQTFYIGKDNNITLKEGYNLLDGRAVNKDLVNKEQEKYNAWVQLDFKETDNQGNFKLKQFHENYGFDLPKALEKHPIKELNNQEDQSRLIDSLKKGNRQSVTFTGSEGKDQKRFIEASPQFKNVNIYDTNLMRTSETQRESKSESQSKTKKQEVKEESDESPTKKTRKRKSTGIAG